MFSSLFYHCFSSLVVSFISIYIFLISPSKSLTKKEYGPRGPHLKRRSVRHPDGHRNLGAVLRRARDRHEGHADRERRRKGELPVLLREDVRRAVRPALADGGFGAQLHRRREELEVRCHLRRGVSGEREGGRGEQLREGPLHGRQGDNRQSERPAAEAGGQLR